MILISVFAHFESRALRPTGPLKVARLKPIPRHVAHNIAASFNDGTFMAKCLDRLSTISGSLDRAHSYGFLRISFSYTTFIDVGVRDQQWQAISLDAVVR